LDGDRRMRVGVTGCARCASPPPGTPSDLVGRRRLVAPVADGRL